MEITENEEKFSNLLNENGFYEGLIVSVYWSVDDNDKVIIDDDSMREEFNSKITELKELAKEINQ